MAVRTRPSFPVVFLYFRVPYKDLMKILCTPGFIAKVAMFLIILGAVLGSVLST
jgi:hypothetical protein